MIYTINKAEAEVILASKPEAGGPTLWTIRARYWRSFHGELLTHRSLGRNAGSSRAKPVKKVLAQVWNDPAGPTHWGVNKAGMQADEELTGWRLAAAKLLWRLWGKVGCGFAALLMKLGGHKQWVNRGLEPWQYIDVLITATDWDNFFELRDHKDAQPEFQDLAKCIRKVMQHAEQTNKVKRLGAGEWHLPMILPDEQSLPLMTKLKLSCARCARISIAPFDGNASVKKEIERFNLLVGSTPRHMSPTEHQARPLANPFARNRHLQGWEPFRNLIENQVEP